MSPPKREVTLEAKKMYIAGSRRQNYMESLRLEGITPPTSTSPASKAELIAKHTVSRH